MITPEGMIANLYGPVEGKRHDKGMLAESMSKVRVSVEWVFGEIINYSAFMDFKKNLKIGLSSVGKMYITCALLHNAKTCLYHNSTTEFSGIDPPSIDNYFQ